MMSRMNEDVLFLLSLEIPPIGYVLRLLIDACMGPQNPNFEDNFLFDSSLLIETKDAFQSTSQSLAVSKGVSY